MKQYRCPDCGQIFEETAEYCPSCGCPKQYCELTETSVSHEQSQEYYYVDFGSFKKFSSDPALLTFICNVRWIKWLCAPWHIGSADDGVDYNIANDLFFIYNRWWKLLTYPSFWAICKGWWIFLLTMLLPPVFMVFFVWFLWIGLGKSCHRYGIPLIRCLRHLIQLVSRDIKRVVTTNT